MQNYSTYLKSKPEKGARVKSENFRYGECSMPTLSGDNDVIIQTLYISIEPALASRIDNRPYVQQFIDQWLLNEPIEGLSGVGVTLQSSCASFQVGTIVEAAFGWPWKVYFSANECDASLRLSMKKVDEVLVKRGWLTAPLSCLGMVGLSSLLSLDMCRPQKKDICVISNAAGPCGSLTAQIAALLGCNQIIGICSCTSQADVLTAELGFTNTIDLSCTKTIKLKLRELSPHGINIYIDNGMDEVRDDVMLQVKAKGRVAVCEQAFLYNGDSSQALPSLSDEADMHADMNEIKRERFVCLLHESSWKEASTKLSRWLLNGDLKVKETVYEGLDKAGKAMEAMLSGESVGSVIVKVSSLDSEI